MPAGGRGRGSGLSFSTESLGLGRGDILPSAVLSPPPTFPPLSNKPVKLHTGNEFVLTKSRDLRNYFRSSQFYLRPESDPRTDLDLDWSQFPQELRPHTGSKNKKTKSAAKVNLVTKKSNIDIQTTLSALEQKENSTKDGKQEPQDDSEEEEEEEKQSEHGSDAEEPDEEMDGGTDYANNYFDNGEEYLDDEDDNLNDEGGIY